MLFSFGVFITSTGRLFLSRYLNPLLSVDIITLLSFDKC